jgi:hypothetical protein
MEKPTYLKNSTGITGIITEDDASPIQILRWAERGLGSADKRHFPRKSSEKSKGKLEYQFLQKASQNERWQQIQYQGQLG